MKKLIAFSSVALLLPGLALAAAYNDVSLDSNVVLSVNGSTVNVTSATIPEITVGSSTFDVVLGPGSSMTISTSGGKKMTYSDSSFLVSNQCDGTASAFTMTAPSDAATTTITVTVTSTTCADATTSSSSSSGGGGGAPVGLLGGGGGGGSTLTSIVPTTPAPAPTPAPASVGSVQPQEILALVTQLQSLIQLLESLGGGVSPETKALLNSFSAPVGFDRDLEVGSTGDDVVALQVYLNAHGYTLASSGPGSPGNETSRFGGLTRAALAKFQADNGITPSVGYFGLKTRAFVNAHP